MHFTVGQEARRGIPEPRPGHQDRHLRPQLEQLAVRQGHLEQRRGEALRRGRGFSLLRGRLQSSGGTQRGVRYRHLLH